MKELFEVFEKSTQSAMDAIKKMTELNMRTFDKVMQQQADLTGIYMDVGNKGLELMGKAKGFQDLMAGQATLAREYSERCGEALRKSMSVANESRTEYGTMVEENMKLAQEQIARVSSVSMKVAA